MPVALQRRMWPLLLLREGRMTTMLLWGLLVALVVLQACTSCYWVWRAKGAEESALYWYRVAVRRPRKRHADQHDPRFAKGSPEGAVH